MKILFSFFVLVVGSSSYAMNMSGCDKLLNDGWFRKYEYQGVDQPATKATKKHGSSLGSTKASTERSTATLDPKYWTNNSTSIGQYITSTGPCAALAYQDLYENRERYIAQNQEAVLKEISLGRGEHLRVLATFSLCDEEAYDRYAAQLQGSYERFSTQKTSEIGSQIDQSIARDPELIGRCYTFGS